MTLQTYHDELISIAPWQPLSHSLAALALPLSESTLSERPASSHPSLSSQLLALHHSDTLDSGGSLHAGA